MKDYESSKGATIQAGLYDCNAGYTGCTTIATGATTANPWSPTGTWTSHSVNLGTVNHTVPAGRTLVIKLVVDPASDDQLWFAYDTTQHPANLTITP